jgi:hypothetical protein
VQLHHPIEANPFAVDEDPGLLRRPERIDGNDARPLPKARSSRAIWTAITAKSTVTRTMTTPSAG